MQLWAMVFARIVHQDNRTNSGKRDDCYKIESPRITLVYEIIQKVK